MQTVANTPAPQTNGAYPSQTPESPTATGGDFETFLTLLTAQMRNQDPMKPMDSTAFVAQLASFSAVEQQVKTNTYLESMLGAISNTSGNNISDWIGKEVRHTGSGYFSGQPKEIAVSINPEADRADLVIHNASGIEVDRIPLNPAAQAVLWPQNTGIAPPVGAYSFSVENFKDDQSIGTSDAETYDLVNEVRIGSNDRNLVLEGGIDIPVSGVSSIRAAQT